VLDESRTVLGNVEEGVAETKALIERYNEITAQTATDYSDELLEEIGRLQDAWDLDSRIGQAMHTLRCPPPDAEVSLLSGARLGEEAARSPPGHLPQAHPMTGEGDERRRCHRSGPRGRA